MAVTSTGCTNLTHTFASPKWRAKRHSSLLRHFSNQASMSSSFFFSQYMSLSRFLFVQHKSHRMKFCYNTVTHITWHCNVRILPVKRFAAFHKWRMLNKISHMNNFCSTIYLISDNYILQHYELHLYASRRQLNAEWTVLLR